MVEENPNERGEEEGERERERERKRARSSGGSHESVLNVKQSKVKAKC